MRRVSAMSPRLSPEIVPTWCVIQTQTRHTHLSGGSILHVSNRIQRAVRESRTWWETPDVGSLMGRLQSESTSRCLRTFDSVKRRLCNFVVKLLMFSTTPSSEIYPPPVRFPLLLLLSDR